MPTGNIRGLLRALAVVTAVVSIALTPGRLHAQAAPLIQYTLPGETGSILGIAVAHNGAYFVTIDSNGMAYERNCTSGAILYTLQQPQGTLSGVTVSADSKTIYTAVGAPGGPYGTNMLLRWNAAGGNLLSATPVPAAPNGLSASSDGKYIAIAGADGSIYLYSTSQGQITTKLPAPAGDTNAVTCVACSPKSGATLVSGDAGGGLYIWNTSKGSVSKVTDSNSGDSMVALVFSPTSPDLFVAVSGNGGGFVVASVAKKAVQIGPVVLNYPTSASISSDGATLAIGSNKDESVNLFDLPRGLPTGTPWGTGGGAVAYAPNTHDLIVGAANDLVLGQDSSGNLLATWNVVGPPGSYSYYGASVATATGGGEFAIYSSWGVSRFSTNSTLNPSFGLIENVSPTGIPPIVYSGDATLLAYVDFTGDYTPEVYDVVNQVLLSTSIPTGTALDNALGLPAQDTSIVVYNGTNVSTYLGFGSLASSQYPISSLYSSPAMTPDGAFLADWTYSSGYGIDVWNTQTGANNFIQAGTSNDVYRPSLSNDGTVLAAVVQSSVEVFNASTGAMLTTLQTGDTGSITLSPMTLSPNGDVVAAYRSDGWLDLWRINDQAHIAYNAQLGQGIVGITFSQDETRLYLTRADGPVMVVYNPFVIGLTLSSTDLIGGQTNATGTVTLWAKAAKTVTVQLATSDSSSLTVPATIAVAAGKTSAIFTVTSKAVVNTTQVAVIATYNGVTSTVWVTVEPQTSVAALTLNPSSLVGGYDVVGAVELSAKAPTAGLTISLYSGDPSVIVPATILVLPGKKNALFEIATAPVTQTTKVTITAVHGASIFSTPLTVNPVTVASLVLVPSAISGGDDAVGLISLNMPAPTDTVVTITSSAPNTAAPDVTSITIPAGYQQAGFYLSSASVTTAQTVTFTVTANGASQTAMLTVNP